MLSERQSASVARQRKLAAILCADIAGFSRLMGEDEAATYDGLARLRAAIDPLISLHRGRIVSTAGDGFLADFGSVVDALSCAVEIQEAARAVNEPLSPERRLLLRIGVNLGDVIVADDNDLFGDGVNVAARLQTLAAPGGICLSRTVYEHVRNKLPLVYRSLGSHRVKNIAEPVHTYAVATGAPRRAGLRLTRRLALYAMAAVLVVVNFGLLAWLVRGSLLHAPSSASAAAAVSSLAAPAHLAERIAVAVLPFKNLSPEPGQDYFSDGITEDITNALGRFSELLVAAKSASFQLKGRSMSAKEAGHELSVRYLVGGSVRRASDELRITVELTDAATGFQLWSETYNTHVKDVFAVQDQITKQIVGLTAVKLTHLERERVLRQPTANLAAYELVLRGRAGLTDPTRVSNDEARSLFQRAIKLDPNYAAAYAALGWTYYEAVVSGWTEFDQDALTEAAGLAQKALALDPDTASAFRLLAEIAVFHHDYERALQKIDQALAINPSNAENFRVRRYILLWSGRSSEAVSWLEGALRFDAANSVAALQLGIAHYFVGQYPNAIAALDRALAGDPGRIIQLNAHPVLAAAFARLQKTPEVARERAAVERLSPFFDADRFAAQFGTQQARENMLAGLKAAGFR